MRNRRPAVHEDWRARAEVVRCLSALWPLLMEASNAIDGPRPSSAERHLRAAAGRLLASADQLATASAPR